MTNLIVRSASQGSSPKTGRAGRYGDRSRAESSCVLALSSVAADGHRVLPTFTPPAEPPHVAINSPVVSSQYMLAPPRSRKRHCQFHKHLATQPANPDCTSLIPARWSPDFNTNPRSRRENVFASFWVLALLMPMMRTNVPSRARGPMQIVAARAFTSTLKAGTFCWSGEDVSCSRARKHGRPIPHSSGAQPKGHALLRRHRDGAALTMGTKDAGRVIK